jgi:hypothetical protein
MNSGTKSDDSCLYHKTILSQSDCGENKLERLSLAFQASMLFAIKTSGYNYGRAL